MSLLRKQESGKHTKNNWIPAFAGMTLLLRVYNFVPFYIERSIDSIPLAKEKMLNNTLQTKEQTEGLACQVKY
jgi:hypothetical protein